MTALSVSGLPVPAGQPPFPEAIFPEPAFRRLLPIWRLRIDRVLKGCDVLQQSICAIWVVCPRLKSPDPEHLKCFWTFFTELAYFRQRFIEILSPRLTVADAVPAKDLPVYLMFLELLLVNGNYRECIDLGAALTVHHTTDLRLQDIRARAYLLDADDSRLATDREYGYKPFADNFCSSPFDRIFCTGKGGLFQALRFCAKILNCAHDSFRANCGPSPMPAPTARLRRFRTLAER